MRQQIFDTKQNLKHLEDSYRKEIFEEIRKLASEVSDWHLSDNQRSLMMNDQETSKTLAKLGIQEDTSLVFTICPTAYLRLNHYTGENGDSIQEISIYFGDTAGSKALVPFLSSYPEFGTLRRKLMDKELLNLKLNLHYNSLAKSDIEKKIVELQNLIGTSS